MQDTRQMSPNQRKAIPSTLYLYFVTVWLTIALGACTTVSPEAVTLSEVVNHRVTAMQTSHEAFVRGYFNQSRERIEDFLIEKWIPEFLDQFVNDSTGTGEDLLHEIENATPFDAAEIERLQKELRKRDIKEIEATITATAAALGGGERGQSVLNFAEAAMGQIEKKRRALLDPIDDLERRTLQELGASYSQIQQAQGSVTSHLRSLSDVQEEQEQFLRRLQLLEKRDQFVERALAVNEGVTGILEAGKSIEETLTALENNLHTVTALGTIQ